MKPIHFKAMKRTAIDGRMWWCVYGLCRHAWSSFVCFGKYKTRKACEWAISANEKLLECE